MGERKKAALGNAVMDDVAAREKVECDGRRQQQQQKHHQQQLLQQEHQQQQQLQERHQQQQQLQQERHQQQQQLQQERQQQQQKLQHNDTSINSVVDTKASTASEMDVHEGSEVMTSDWLTEQEPEQTKLRETKEQESK